MSGPQFLRALLRADVSEVRMVAFGTKMPWADFASLYEGSVDVGKAVTLDLGRTRLYPNHDFIELFQVGGPGARRNPVRIPTFTHGSVHCRTYKVCGTNHGTLHYSVNVSAAQAHAWRQGCGILVVAPLVHHNNTGLGYGCTGHPNNNAGLAIGYDFT